MVLIRLKHDDDDDTSPGGHAKIDCQGDGDGDDHGNGGDYGEIMANIMVFVMAMAMMTAMADGTRQRSHHPYNNDIHGKNNNHNHDVITKDKIDTH